MRPTCKRAVFVGILVGLAQTRRDCYVGLDAASRVHQYQPVANTILIMYVEINERIQSARTETPFRTRAGP